MQRARLAVPLVVSLAAFLMLAAVDAGASPEGGLFGYGTVFDNDSMTYDFVGFPPVTTIAPLDVQLLAGTFVGTDYSTLYAIDSDAELVKVDTATGVQTIVGPLGIIPQPRASFGANPSTGALFAILGDNSCNLTDLYSINSVTGIATLIGPLPECVASVAADPAAGLLYLLDVDASALNVVDALGNETTLGPLGVALNPSARIAIDPVSGVLFLIEFDPGSFTNIMFTVDTTTGAATLVGPLGGENPIGAPVLAPAPAGPLDRIFADGFDPEARAN